MSSCSSISSISTQFPMTRASSSSENMESSPMLNKRIKKSVPEIDNFAKRRKYKDDQIDRDLAEASSAISTAMEAISSQFCDQKRKTGYMSAIQEGLDYVPARNKTQCLIEVLQVIQKYEERI